MQETPFIYCHDARDRDSAMPTDTRTGHLAFTGKADGEDMRNGLLSKTLPVFSFNSDLFFTGVVTAGGIDLCSLRAVAGDHSPRLVIRPSNM